VEVWAGLFHFGATSIARLFLDIRTIGMHLQQRGAQQVLAIFLLGMLGSVSAQSNLQQLAHRLQRHRQTGELHQIARLNFLQGLLAELDGVVVTLSPVR
jgi:hypothetical protein